MVHLHSKTQPAEHPYFLARRIELGNEFKAARLEVHRRGWSRIRSIASILVKNFLKKIFADMNFQTQYTYTPLEGEVFSTESMVEPNCCMPLRQMLIRYANGQPINIPRVDSTYTSDYVKDLDAYNVLRERGLELADAEKVYKQLRELSAKRQTQRSEARSTPQTPESEEKAQNEAQEK